MTIHTIAIQKAIKLLHAAGAQYHIKRDDQEFGKAIGVIKTKTYPTHRKVGDLAAIFKPHVVNLQAGQSAIIPCHPYTAEEVRTSLCAYASKNWGAGSYITSVSHEPEQIEILRVE